MNRIHYGECPVCSSRSINPLLTVKDHSVSGESFVIWHCADCSLRFTQDVPGEDSIAPYYRSQDYISHSNTDKGLLNKLYKQVRKYTIRQKTSFIIGQTVKTGSILDLGAGTGTFASAMRDKGWQVSAVEPDEGARQQAKKLYGLHMDASMAGRFSPRSFDAITLWHVLEHVHALHDYMDMLKTLLKPGGKIFIAVPNYTATDADIYKTWWAAYDVPRHLYHFSPESMDALLNKHGLKITAKKPMWFDSFYISLLSSRYKRGKPSWVGAFLSGFRSNATALFSRDRCSSILYVAE